MLPSIHITLLAGWMLTGGATRLQEECASSFTRSWAPCVFYQTCRDRNNPLKFGDMTTRSEREKAQKQNEQHQAILSKLLREDDNKYCADCQAKGKRNTHALTSIGLATHTLWLKTAGSKCVCEKINFACSQLPHLITVWGWESAVWSYADITLAFLLTLGRVIPIKILLSLLKFTSPNSNTFVARLLWQNNINVCIAEH